MEMDSKTSIMHTMTASPIWRPNSGMGNHQVTVWCGKPCAADSEHLKAGCATQISRKISTQLTALEHIWTPKWGSRCHTVPCIAFNAGCALSNTCMEKHVVMQKLRKEQMSPYRRDCADDLDVVGSPAQVEDVADGDRQHCDSQGPCCTDIHQLPADNRNQVLR